MKKSTTFFIILTSLTVGYFLGIYLHTHNPNISTEDRIDSGIYKYINPLLSCDSAGISQDVNLDKLKSEITELVSNKVENGFIDYASVYYRDMNNGPWFGIQEKELFSPASLIKVPLMMAYFKKAEIDPSLLAREIEFIPRADTIPQNIPPELSLVPQQKYTIKNLIERMIKYSDNDAYFLLFDNISNDEVSKVYSDLGIDISSAQNNPNGNIISVKTYASFFRILFNASYLTPEYSEESLKLLGDSQFKTALVAGVPKEVAVAHKFGERGFTDTKQQQLHDCGIVYIPGKPYLVCVMTRGRDFSRMASVIRDISAIIYNHAKQ